VRDDEAHQLGYALAEAIIAPWPELDEAMSVGLAPHRAKVHHVGGLSRFDGREPEPEPAPTDQRQVLVLSGAGGTDREHRPSLPQHWRCVQRGPGRWVDDLWPDLCAADVVVTHCGLGAVSEVAAARKPAILFPESRPHEEQVRTARGLTRAGLGVVLQDEPAADEWEAILAKAMTIDPESWSRWSNGDAAARSAEIIMGVAGTP
jgi:hypothetical protein